MSQKLKELYEHPFFHGIIWHENHVEEAYNLCKAKMEESGKSYAKIFFLLETQDKVSLKVYLYEKVSEVAYICHERNLKQSDLKHMNVNNLFRDPLHPRYIFVERRNPHDYCLSQIARANIMDNINCRCRTKTDRCVRNLEEKIDQLRIPKPEKVNIKKLIHILNVL